MILNQLKEYIISHPNCTSAQLAKVFDLSEDGIEAMLIFWQKKNLLTIEVEQIQGKKCCKYRWIKEGELGIKICS